MSIRLLNKITIACLYSLRPFLGPARCKFTITCTRFAILQLQELPFHKAVWNIIKRLLSCSPF